MYEYLECTIKYTSKAAKITLSGPYIVSTGITNDRNTPAMHRLSCGSAQDWTSLEILLPGS